MSRAIVVPTEEAVPAHPALREAARILGAGGVVAFPTETVYGLGADIRNAQAVERIFQAKGRPADNPLIVHVAERSQLDAIVTEIDPLAERLMRQFWPGPLTIVLPARPGAVAPNVTAGLETVAVRMPAHPLALALIREAGFPLAAPSANRSGRPSPTTAAHVLDDLSGQVDLVLDGGACGIGLESTVVQITKGTIALLRAGGISRAQLQEASGGMLREGEPQATAEHHADSTPRSPGMKYKHYAPSAEMVVVTGSKEKVIARVHAEVTAARQQGRKVGVLTYVEHAAHYDADAVVACGRLEQPKETARRLYADLRRFDELEVDYIVAEAYRDATDGLAQVIFNRLCQAAGYRVIDASR